MGIIMIVLSVALIVMVWGSEPDNVFPDREENVLVLSGLLMICGTVYETFRLFN